MCGNTDRSFISCHIVENLSDSVCFSIFRRNFYKHLCQTETDNCGKNIYIFANETKQLYKLENNKNTGNYLHFTKKKQKTKRKNLRYLSL